MRIVRIRNVLTTLALVLAGACAVGAGTPPDAPVVAADTPSPDLASALVCYHLDIGDWEPAVVPRHLPDPELVPPYIRLDTARVYDAHGEAVRVADALVDGAWQSRHFGAWRRLPGDSIQVEACPRRPDLDVEDFRARCPPPMGGYRLRLSTGADALTGRITTESDMIIAGEASHATAFVVAPPVACPEGSPPGSAAAVASLHHRVTCKLPGLLYCTAKMLPGTP